MVRKMDRAAHLAATVAPTGPTAGVSGPSIHGCPAIGASPRRL